MSRFFGRPVPSSAGGMSQVRYPQQAQPHPQPQQVPAGYSFPAPPAPGYNPAVAGVQYPQEMFGGVIGSANGVYVTSYNPFKQRKPSKTDIKQEVGIFENVFGGEVVSIEDSPQRVTHVCGVAPLVHTLDVRAYEVQMPGYVLSVQYFVHHDCKKLIFVDSTLSG